MMQEVINYILKELGYIDCATRQLNRAMRAQSRFNGLMWITVSIIGAQTVATEFKLPRSTPWPSTVPASTW